MTEQEAMEDLRRHIGHGIYEVTALIAINALEEQEKRRWIPCSERLPNEAECNIYDEDHPCHRQFICTIKIGEYKPQTRQLFYSKVFGWKYGPEDYNQHVLAWQPLPEPYKAEESAE